MHTAVMQLYQHLLKGQGGAVMATLHSLTMTCCLRFRARRREDMVSTCSMAGVAPWQLRETPAQPGHEQCLQCATQYPHLFQGQGGPHGSGEGEAALFAVGDGTLDAHTQVGHSILYALDSRVEAQRLGQCTVLGVQAIACTALPGVQGL